MVQPRLLGIVVLVMLVAALLMIAGCATVPYQPPTGEVWGFTEKSAINNSNGILIAPTLDACERIQATAKSFPQSHLSTFTACRSVVVGGGETYWLFKFIDTNVTMGASTKPVCEFLRRQGAPATRSACALSAVRFQ